jgi:hypothetical protein
MIVQLRFSFSKDWFASIAAEATLLVFDAAKQGVGRTI